MSQTSLESIAIVGIGCRFPGGVTDVASYWDLISSGKDGIVDVPSDRWSIDRFYDTNRDTPGKMYVRAGGFLQQKIDDFDARFFGMSPREAAYLDPQQRLLLETAWEAFEDAGIDPDNLIGSDVGVYVGGFMVDNLLTQLSPLNREAIGAHSEVGSTLSILSNRLSYVFDLRGPSMTIDTACSSSLVAFHQACTAIARGDCSMALVGGVNVMHRPENFIAMCKGGFLSADGRSKSFDSRADGYGRGEGAGVVVLKPLSQALADGDQIYATVRGTGVNQDGRTDGITVPNPEAQQQLVERVCKDAGVQPRNIRYVEAHGTGTPVGDPLESAALGAAIGQHRSADDPCIVGSVKANIGHLEAASGVAGLIKACLVLRHRKIPPVANLQELNPNIPFADLNLRVPTSLEPLPEGDGPICVGINSFGYGGTNAHAILEAAPSGKELKKQDGADCPYLFAFSARSKDALSAVAGEYAEWLKQGSQFLPDLAFSLATRRSHHDQRLAIVASEKDELIARLQTFARGIEGAPTAGTATEKGRKPVFVFSGMGPQWWAMGRELYNTIPVFSEMLQKIDVLFTALSGWSILAEMLRDEADSRITETHIAQPANFALQVALVAYWRSLGVEPTAIVGHSVGEVAAAYVAGVLDLEQAVLVSYWRSHIQSKAAGQGGMLAVSLSEADAGRYVNGSYGNVCIAAVNSPTTVTLAGDRASLSAIGKELDGQGVFQRELVVEMAYHSAYMEPLKPMLLEALARLNPNSSVIPLYSTVTGQRATPGMYDAQYWCDNVREPVAFAKAITTLIEDGHRVFLEVGPHPVLGGAIRECGTQASVKVATFASLRRDKPEQANLWDNLAKMYQAGVAFDMGRSSSESGNSIRLLSYPWQRDSHWQETPSALFDRVGTVSNPLLGQRSNTPETAWDALLNANLLPYLRDHCVEELTVLPGAAYVELGLAVQRELGGTTPVLLDHLQFFKALVIDQNRQPSLRVTYDAAGRRYQVFSRATPDAGWDLHAVGRIAELPDAVSPTLKIAAIRDRCQEHIDGAAHYADMNERGLHYGPWFQGITSLSRNVDLLEVLAKIDMHADMTADADSLLHPTLLDACFQALLAVTKGNARGLGREVYVPTRIGQVRFYARPSSQFYCHASLSRAEPGLIVGDVTLMDNDGRVLAEIHDVEARALTNKRGDALASFDEWLYQFEWRETPLIQDPALELRDTWIVVSDDHDLSQRLTHELKQCGVKRVMVAHFAHVEDDDKAKSHDVESYFPHLMREVLDTGAERVQGVVSLLAANLANEQIAGQLAASTSGALRLVQTLIKRRAGDAPRLAFVTKKAQAVDSLDAQSMCIAQSPLVGFARVAINEFPDLRTRLVDMDDAPDALAALAAELISGSEEDEVALRGVQRYVNRLVRRTSKVLNASEGSKANEPAAAEVVVALQKATLFGSSENNAQRPVTGEAMGVVVRAGANVRSLQVGDSVIFPLQQRPSQLMTVAGADVSLITDPALVPWVPAEYVLTQLGKLVQGQAVLVHAGVNPLALAIVQVAVQAGARVFVSASDASLRHACMTMGAEQAFNLHSPDLRQLLRNSGFAGEIDLSINATLTAVSGRHLKTMKTHGTHIELHDLDRARLIDLEDAPGSICLMSLDIKELYQRSQDHVETAEKVRSRLASGKLQLPLQAAYSALKLDEAINTTQQARMALVDFDRSIETIMAQHVMTPSRFLPDETYLLTGGLGGIGLKMAEWMIGRGARNLVLVGRKGANTSEAVDAVAHLCRSGAMVTPYAADVSDKDAVKRLIEHIEKEMPPLRGVFHAAAVLDDGPIDGLADANFSKVLNAKSVGAWHLHEATQHLPLRHFVLFSSIGSLVGSPGQATYVAANAFLDALAQWRRANHMAALSINWGALAEVGMAARHREVAEYLDRVGFGAFGPDVAMEVFGRLLDANPVVIGAAAMDWATLSGFYPAWGRSLRNHEILGTLESTMSGDSHSQWSHILEAMAPEERLAIVGSLLNQTVSDVLRFPLDSIDQSQSLLYMGMDSIMAIELQVQIEGKFDVKLSTLELMRGNTLAELTEQILKMLTDNVASQHEKTASVGLAEALPQKTIVQIPDFTGNVVPRIDVGDIELAIENLTDADVQRTLELLSSNIGEQ